MSWSVSTQGGNAPGIQTRAGRGVLTAARGVWLARSVERPPLRVPALTPAIGGAKHPADEGSQRSFRGAEELGIPAALQAGSAGAGVPAGQGPADHLVACPRLSCPATCVSAAGQRRQADAVSR